MASNAKNLAELLNNESTIAVADVADGSITTAKLADDAVTNAKIGANAVGTTEVADDAVTEAKINPAGLGKFGRRNVVINGAMQIAQRSTSTTGLGAASGYHTLDRMNIDVSGTAGRFTMSQEQENDMKAIGFSDCLKLDCTTADTSIAAGEYLTLGTRFEGKDVQRFKKGTSSAEVFAVSFYVKGNASATYALELYDQDNNRQISKTFNVTTSWSRVELLFPADTTGTFTSDVNQSLIMQIWLHAGTTWTGGTLNSSAWGSSVNNQRAVSTTSFFDSTDRTFFITGWQLEVGEVTDFEHRGIGEESMLCYRYLQRFPKQLTFQGLTASAGVAQYSMRTDMRANPTLVNDNSSPYWENTPWTSAGTSLSGFTITINGGHCDKHGGDVNVSGSWNPSIVNGKQQLVRTEKCFLSAEI